MYIEFVISYIFYGVIVALLIAILVLQILILKKSGGRKGNNYYQNPMNTYGNAGYSNAPVVFCQRCRTQYDSMHKVCPKCGSPRQ